MLLMINVTRSSPRPPVGRRTLLGLVPLVAGGLILATTAQPANAASAAAGAAQPAPECLADLLEA
ncbi:hypothetical protein GA0070619_6093 [Micromonospora zamorensis]|nr:hypothetical protein GA0070619_6093 [Micromonospora zamorensis]